MAVVSEAEASYTVSVAVAASKTEVSKEAVVSHAVLASHAVE